MSIEKELTLIGNADDLLNVTNNGETKIIKLIKDDENIEQTSISLEMWSDDKTKTHEILNQFLNKKIQITIKIID